VNDKSIIFKKHDYVNLNFRTVE